MGLISRDSSRTYRQNTMSKYDPNNIFAKIIRGEIPSYKIFETDDVLAILDAFPCAPGHSLLIPKNCEEQSIETMTPEASAKLFAELPKLCQIVKKATKCDAVNVLSNLGAEAGQMVFHPHIHVIPRSSEDGLLKHPPACNGMIDKEDAMKMLES